MGVPQGVCHLIADTTGIQDLDSVSSHQATSQLFMSPDVVGMLYSGLAPLYGLPCNVA